MAVSDAFHPGDHPLMHRSVATAVCGRRTKYLVILFWVVMTVVLGSLASKLPDV